MSGRSAVWEDASRRVGERDLGEPRGERERPSVASRAARMPGIFVAATRSTRGCASRRWSNEPATAGLAAATAQRTEGPSGGWRGR